MLSSDRTMMRAGGWRCLTIDTGEIPIVDLATQQDAALYAGQFSFVHNVVRACGHPQDNNIVLLALVGALAQTYAFALREAFAVTEIGRGATRLEHDMAE